MPTVSSTLERLQRRSTMTYSLMGLLVFTLLLRLYQLDAEPIWSDEADTLLFSLVPWSELFSNFLKRGHNGPLYYVITKAWLHLTGGLLGDSLLELRLLSVLCGSLCLAPAYWLGNRLNAKRGSLYLCLLMATSPHLIWYAKDGKMYSLLLLLTMLSSLLIIYAVETKKWEFWLGYGMLIILSWYIHLLSVLILPVHLLYVLSQQTKRVRRWMLLGLLMIGMASSWYVFNWHIPTVRINFIALTFPGLLADTFQTQLFVFSAGFPNPWQSPAIILYAALLGIGVTNFYKAAPSVQPYSRIALGFYFLVPIIGMAALRTIVGVYETRYLIMIAPAFYGFVTLALLKLPLHFSYITLTALLILNLLAS